MSIPAFVKQLVPARWAWRVRVRRWNVGYPDPELHLLPRFCTGTCVDVGASLGLYTMHMLGYADEVWAFEPRAEQAARLIATLGPDPRLHVEAVALSDTNGSGTFRACPDDPGRSTLEEANRLNGWTVEQVSVPVRTLDSYHLTQVSCIKIDVEGHEEAVLRGAVETLRSSRPALILELEDRHNPGITRRVPQWLSPFGYKQFYYWRGQLLRADGEAHPGVGTNAVFLS